MKTLSCFCLVIISRSKILSSGPVHQHTYKYFPSLRFFLLMFVLCAYLIWKFSSFCFLMSLRLDQRFSMKVSLSHRVTFDNVCRHFGFIHRRRMPNASSQEPETELNIQECTGQASTTENYPAPNVNSIKNGNA